MNNYTIVRPEHLNHHGYLFGGAMLKWIDDFAWLVASRDFTGCKMVTIGMDKISFRHRVLSGSILRFNILPHSQGRTSMCYDINVYADEEGATTEKHVFSTQITFVRVDSEGNKAPLPVIDKYWSEG